MAAVKFVIEKTIDLLGRPDQSGCKHVTNIISYGCAES